MRSEVDGKKSSERKRKMKWKKTSKVGFSFLLFEVLGRLLDYGFRSFRQLQS